MARTLPQIEHLLRRAGFGGTADELTAYGDMGYAAAVEALLNFTPTGADFIDDAMRTPGYIGVVATRAFEPQTNITDTRQRWLFRMVHTPAPLQEKLALFWHNHFATGYNKINGVVGAADAARLMDSRASRDPLGYTGEIELFRTMGMGKFTDLLTAVSKHASMLIWLDGRQNTRTSPQENFGREVMELFTVGVANYVETDVYAAARVFTGWNYNRTTPAGTVPISNFTFQYNANQHETSAKAFSFPVYSNGSKTIPARAKEQGEQDGIDLLYALAHHPETAKRLARKLWTFFVSELREPDPAFVDAIAKVYLANDTEMRPVIRAVLNSPQFTDPQAYFQRYAWPIEYVIRSIKEIGFLGYSVNDTLTPLVTMGQTLYEPPDVSGWDLGTWWFSTGAMLARMNFVAGLATNQKFNLRDLARPYKASPETLISGFALSRLTAPPPDAEVYGALLDYVRAGGNWTGSDTQLANKAGGTVHLIAGSADYQFV